MSDNKFQFTRNFVLRKIVDESILVPVSPSLEKRDTLLVMNPTAARFLELAREERPLSEIRSALLAEFEVEPAQLESDLRLFLRHMTEAEVLRELPSAD